ncbi:MAG TPA: TonB-dependent receptor [Terriglobia bacterium]|nr:TonB-dependent receptor [Terriglobia bacterium]
MRIGKITFFASVCLCVFMIPSAYGQSSNATISGSVVDPAGAAVPDATITAENTKTGVVSTMTTSGAGVYQFPSLVPGTYRVSVEKEGFRKETHQDLVLEISAKLNLNFQLEVAGVSSRIEVKFTLDSTLGTTSTSVGGVINDQRIQNLPLPDRDALGLVLTQGGLYGDNFAGSRIGALNVTRDGINIMDQTINLGVNSVFFTSVDSVSEVRVITSPADAELGRGSGQVEILTRSGTNEFHGSIFELHHNSALNANNWAFNWLGIPRDPLTSNQFGARLDGPIDRKKTFFHVLYEGLRERPHERVTATVLTPQARQGIFRFFPGALNSNADAPNPAVDLTGNPVRPVGATGDLRSVNVFAADPFRRSMDRTGLMQGILKSMPLPNDYRAGDGLNTAGYTWLRPLPGDRDQIDTRLDHWFNPKNHLAFVFTRETIDGVNSFMPQQYPDSPSDRLAFRTTFFSLSLTSTLNSRLVNEFRAGEQRSKLRFYAPWESEAGLAALPQAGGRPYLLSPASFTPLFDTSNGPQARIAPLYSYADTLTWIKARHALKGGLEVRFASANSSTSFDLMPRTVFGSGGVPVSGLDSFSVPGLGVNEIGAQNLLVDLSGSVDHVLQAFNATGGSNPLFVENETRQRTWRQREFSAFFKDDFNVRPNLTLNLGVRYEYYGVPFEANGKAAAIAGGSTGLFGISGTSFADLYHPGLNNGSLTRIELVGKNSANPQKKLYNNDWNNFAPAVGLSWSLPYFGRDKTILRMGYSVGYERNALRLVDIVSGDQPGLSTTSYLFSQDLLTLADVRLPLTPIERPLETVPLTDRFQTVRSFDTNLRTPYVQNWNLTVGRQLPGNFGLEVRYVGSKGTKLVRAIDINEVNIFENQILDAFRITQAGESAPLFDRIFNGLNLGLGRVNGTTVRGSASLRALEDTRAFLASNSAGAFAQYLNSTPDFTGVPGGLLRRAGLPENFIVGNPQFGEAVLIGNLANSTYHSFQVEAEKRFSRGWTLQSNYTWSKALGEEEGDSQNLQNSYRNGRDRHADKRILGFNRTHIARTNGTVELPFGPGRRFLGNSASKLGQLVGNWQFGTIFHWFSGPPLGFESGVLSLNQFVDNTPTLVGALPAKGRVQRGSNGATFFAGLKTVPDPAIQSLTNAQGLAESSSIRAVADTAGNLIMVNPAPGRLGNLAPYVMTGPSDFRLDTNVVKRFEIHEGSNVEIRADFLDVLNKPRFASPNTDINSTDFGRITAAGGNRIIVLGARINF